MNRSTDEEMAEHKLLSSIYSVMNRLVCPQNSGRGLYAVKDKSVDSLNDLIDGKKLSKLMRCEPQNNTERAAKEAMVSVVIGFLNINQNNHFFKLFYHWSQDFDVLLNFVVLLIGIADELKKISKKRREKVENELNFIKTYFELSVVNVMRLMNGKSIEPLIHLNNTDIQSKFCLESTHF